MKFIKLFIIGTVAVFIFQACSTVEVSRKLNDQKLVLEGQTIGNINADIYGYYLFSVIPIVTGDPYKEGLLKFFTDTITVPHGVDMLTRKSLALGADHVVDMHTTYVSEWMPIWLVLWEKEVQVSGNAIK